MKKSLVLLVCMIGVVSILIVGCKQKPAEKMEEAAPVEKKMEEAAPVEKKMEEAAPAGEPSGGYGEPSGEPSGGYGESSGDTSGGYK